MSETPRTAPDLAIRVVPPHRERWDRVGRLYHKPGFVLPDNYQELDKLISLIEDGHLMPSITNVVGVRSAPYLVDWGAKMVAKAGINVALNHAHAARTREYAAFKYLKDLPYNEMMFWANQGTNVHYACELLFTGQDISHLKLTDYEQQSVDQFKRWLDEFQPEINYVEVTGFGTTRTGKLFAGTADFNVKIGKVNVLGDIKCVTDNTLVLMKDGTQKQAKNIQVGDEVVSWDESTGLRTDEVVYAASNGDQKTITVLTELGQQLTTTTNHKYLKNTKTGMQWVESENLQPGDKIYTVVGWVHATERTEKPWPYNKHLSPYLLGLLWTLSHHNPTPWDDTNKIIYPATAKAELFDELADFGFLKSADNKIRVKTGLRRVAKKAKISVEQLLGLINHPTIPDIVFASSTAHQAAFMCGVQEGYLNKTVNNDYFFIEHRSVVSLRSLQQLYFNNGYLPNLGGNPKTGHPVLKIRVQERNEVRVYGLEEVRITRVIVNEQLVHTVALEVHNTHNHVTGSILTHNTNRTGLHTDVALQLAANKNVQEVTLDSQTLTEPVPSDLEVGLHLSPQGYVMQEVDTSAPVLETFEALREVWDFHAFEGRHLNPDGVLGRKIKTLKDL